jgi:hypothetical protein
MTIEIGQELIGKVVLVEWIDHSAFDARFDLVGPDMSEEEMVQKLFHRDVGILQAIRGVYIVLTQGYAPSHMDHDSHGMLLVKSAIVAIKELATLDEEEESPETS